MASAKTITINGRTYDAVTGMLMDTPAEGTTQKATPAASPAKKKEPRAQTASATVHATQQRSKTLNRRATKKPAPTAKQSSAARPPAGKRHMDIARNPQVSRFAPHPETKAAPAPATTPKAVSAPAPKPALKPAAPAKQHVATKPSSPDRAPQAHPAAQRALSKVQAQKHKAAPVAHVTPKQKKDGDIAKAMATPTHKPKKVSFTKKMKARNKKYLVIAIVLLAFVLLAITAYKIFPGISVGIAASRAGISATYPEYTPDGFGLHQPVTFKDGEVTLTFKSNSSERAYTITQQRSSWDSSSVLDNIVQPAAGNDYTTTKERGLTIFTYGNNATWMNGGLLYTISGDTQLSGDQVRRIATSL